MFSWFKQWNKFENRSVFEKVKAYEVKAYKNVPVFWGPPCRSTLFGGSVGSDWLRIRRHRRWPSVTTYDSRDGRSAPVFWISSRQTVPESVDRRRPCWKARWLPNRTRGNRVSVLHCAEIVLLSTCAAIEALLLTISSSSELRGSRGLGPTQNVVQRHTTNYSSHMYS